MAYQRSKKLHLAIEANFKLIEILDANGDGKVDKFEYLSRMLIFTRLCNKAELDDLMKGFDSVDADADGFVDISEIRQKFSTHGSTFYLRRPSELPSTAPLAGQRIDVAE